MKNTTLQTGVLQQVAADVEATGAAFIKTILAIDPGDFNRIPFKGSWTAAQVAEHIRLSVTGTIAIFNAPVMATDRDPGQYIDAVKDIFLDFAAQYPSAAAIIPADKQYSKEALKNQLIAIFEELQQNILAKDLTETCLAAEIPGMGHLTRLEWTYLAVYHTQRHDHQIKKIIGMF
ncbi:DinB superfamily protein [Mucilaginibacter pineti]|uniref:DinB superfamily protein n=1 Tax=Mucilaginibacter pineti TaxID=1391627 RepID=A0A1G7FY60_9SPHI|nr:DinB family protein [Mucilaginibacter pineti]SDE80797.1 DinB superfamily protein [Mucilaginibacter pineti]